MALVGIEQALAETAFQCRLQFAEAGGIDKEAGRAIVHGMPTAEWKAFHHTAATPEQLARMEESMAKNP